MKLYLITIQFDQSSIFVSELLRIQPSLTTTFHPLRWLNGKRKFYECSPREDKMSGQTYSLQLNFAYNNAIHLAILFSPFYASYGYHPRLWFAIPTTSAVPTAEERVRCLQEVQEEIKTKIKTVEEQAKRNYDRACQLQPSFQVGDNVLLRHDYITTTTPFKKLASKFFGQFLITSKILDLVYRLKLPRTLRIHDVFYVSLLEKYQQDTIPGRRQKPPIHHQ